MIGLLLRKNFYDCWDNMFKLFFLNLLVFLITFGTVSLASVLTSGESSSLVPGLLICAIGIIALSVYILAISVGMANIAQYGQFKLKTLPTYIASVWKDGVILGIIVCLWILVVTKVIPWYLALNSTFGLILAAIVFWCAIVVLLMAQWYIPLRSQLPRPFRKTVKKCLLLFFDNPGFSFFLLLYNIVCLILSIFLVTLVPGIAGVVLNLNNALRLRLYKYDWIEENQKTNPDFNIMTARKNIPWETLTKEDEETTGHRSLKNLILPWRE